MQQYRKLMVAIVGVLVILLADYADVKLPFGPEQLVDQIIATVTAIGVWGVPNAA